MFKANYHTHTCLCDGKNTPEEVALSAAEGGFTHLGFSGHMDADIHMDIETYYTKIRSLQEQYRGQMDILRGIELDTLYDPSCAYDAEYIIGSTHFLDVPSETPMSVDSTPENLAQLCREFFGGDYYELAKAYYRLEAQVVARTGCTFIGHYDLVTRFNDDMHFLDEEEPRYRTYALETLEYLVSLGLPFEINCGAVNRGRKKDFYPSRFLLRSLRAFGGEIIISSDAHQKELLTGAFDTAIEAALSCGFTHTNILEHDPDGKVVFRQIPLDQLSY